MRSAYHGLTLQYSRLAALTQDVNYFLQNSDNYIQFDPDIRNAILDTPESAAVPAYIKELPQVKLIKSIRHSIQTIADDFNSDDKTKLVKLIYHLQNFWQVAKAYLLAEKTICLSPEFNSKIISLVSFLIQSNQIFHDELANITAKPQMLFNHSQRDYTNIDNKNWHYYRDKVVALQQLLPNDNKFKPYIKNLERLITFIINLKEKGVLKSNPVSTILEFAESFNKLSRTSIKAILQEYAILSNAEIQEILNQIREFWSSFLPICDEIEINMGLAPGYLTQPLAPAINFSNVMDLEFNLENTEIAYPFRKSRLSRIRHGMKETSKLLEDEAKRKQKLTEFDELITAFEEQKSFNLDKIVTMHSLIEILNCDESQKTNFHRLIDTEFQRLSSQLTPAKKEAVEFNQLLNKYKMHDANLDDVEQLFSMLQDPNVIPSAQNVYQELSDDYNDSIKNLSTTVEKIEKGQIRAKDIKHLLIQINTFEVQQNELVQKSNVVKSAINNQIKNIQKLDELLNLFESNRLQDENLYELLCFVDYLDCDLSIKKKYKKQISDLDYKRKNGGYLSTFSDFVMGLFVEVTLPFSEIRELIQRKLNALQALANEQPGTTLASSDQDSSSNNLVYSLLDPMDFIANKLEWSRLKDIVKADMQENEKNLVALQSIQSFQVQRYQQLKQSLLSYIPPIEHFDDIVEAESREGSPWSKYFSGFLKSAISKTTSLLTTVYSNTKSAFNRLKAFVTGKKHTADTNSLVILRRENQQADSDSIKSIKVSPYKELAFIEDRIAWFILKLVDPKFNVKLKQALSAHQIIPLTEDMPFFYRQGAEIINTFILFRKVLLSYSHVDMLQLCVAVANMNAENKEVLQEILADSMLAKSSSFYAQMLKPTLSTAYQTVANLKAEEDFDTSLPRVAHKIHNAINLIALNKKLDLNPFLEFLNRLNASFTKPNQPLNHDLMKMYSSIQKLGQFVEKVLNNQQNLLVEVAFSLADLTRQFNQISSSITRLLLKDEFPYLKELSEMMKALQAILLLFQDHIDQFSSAGLHPDIINSLNSCTEVTKSVIDQLTPLEFQKARIALDVEQVTSGLSGCGSDRVLKNELDNIHALLTNKADKKLVDAKVLETIETRLQVIKQNLKDSHTHGCFGFFSRRQFSFENSERTHQQFLPVKPKIR